MASVRSGRCDQWLVAKIAQVPLGALGV